MRSRDRAEQELSQIREELNTVSLRLRAAEEENAYLRKLLGLRDKEVLFEEEED
jgi:cell shape-determining protein MreC